MTAPPAVARLATRAPWARRPPALRAKGPTRALQAPQAPPREGPKPAPRERPEARPGRREPPGGAPASERFGAGATRPGAAKLNGADGARGAAGAAGCCRAGKGGISGGRDRTTESIPGAGCVIGDRTNPGYDGAAAGAATAAGYPPRAGAACSPIAITPPHTEQRARTPPSGIFAGSTRKTDPHSWQIAFIASSTPSAECHRSDAPTGAPTIGSFRRSTTYTEPGSVFA